MSSGNVVDSKVVELGFNNQQFESNAKTSISTLDKLKNALNFSGSSKNFEDMNKSLGKIDVKSLSAGVGTLRDSLNSLRNIVVFSWIADEAIKAKNAVEGFLKSVTTQQVAAGWDKYAEKTSAVQTIMAATAKDFSDQGEQMEYVNAQLEKLNWFTDETSYNFLDMVNNIGKFTANNVSLDQAVTSMQGISNWAAISGANVNEAGRAMYNLSQAIAVGSVKLMDWKSIENANMATAEFKQTAIETAESMNMLTKASDDTWKTLAGHEVSVTNFNQALSDGWFTSDVLLKTLDNYGAFTNQLYESLEKMSDDFLTSDLLDLIEDYKSGSIDMNEAVKETGLSAKELTEELDKLSSEEMAFGLKAFKAAQEAKTFQEAVDAVKDAASTGWMNTFEIMFGDYLQAKELWTTLANDLYDIFAEGGNARNDLLKEAFGTQTAVTQADFDLLTKSGIASPAFKAAVRRSAQEHGVVMAKLVSDEEWFQTVLERGELTMEDLNNAYKEVYGSSLADVDQALMDQVKTAAETDESFKSLLDTVDQYNAEQLKEIKFGDGEYTEGLEELEGSLDEIIKSLGLTQEEGQALVDVLIAMKNGGKVTAAQLNEMTDSEIEALGFSEEVTEQLKELKAQGKLTDEAIMDIINNQHKTGGQLWTESLYNGMEAIMNIVEVVREAFHDIFPPTDSGTLFEFLQWLNKATASFAEGVKTSEPFKAALHGIFSAVDLLLRALGAVAKIAKNAFTSVLDVFGINIGSIVEKAGNAVTNFRNWAVENEVFSKTVTVVSNAISGALKWVKGLIDQFLNLPIVSKNLARFKAGFRLAFHSMPAFMKGLGERFTTFKDHVKELGEFKLENLPEIFGFFKTDVLDYISNFTGFKGIKSAFSHLGEDISKVIDDIKGKVVEGLENWRQSLDPNSLIAKIYDFVFGAFASVKAKLAENGGDLFSAIKDSIVEGLTNWRGKLDDSSIVAKIYDFISGAVKKVTGMVSDISKNGDKSIFGKAFDLIVAGITGLFNFLKKVPWGTVGGIGWALAPILVGIKIFKTVWTLITGVSNILSNVDDITAGIAGKFKPNKMSLVIKAIKAVALLIAAITVSLYVISAIPSNRLEDAIITLMGVMAFMAIFIGALAAINELTIDKKTGKGGITKDMALTVAATALAVLLMAVALEKISKIDPERLTASVITLGILAVVLAGMQAVNGYLSGHKMKPKGAKSMITTAIALYALTFALAKIAKIKPNRLKSSVKALVVLALVLAALQVVMGYLNKNDMKIKGSNWRSLLATAASIFILAEALIEIAKIPEDRLYDSVIALAILGTVLAGMEIVMGYISKFGGDVTAGQIVGLIATAGSIYILSKALGEIAEIPSSKLEGAEIAIGVLAAVLGGIEAVLGLINKYGGDVSPGQIISMIAAAGSIYILACALEKISTIPSENLGGVELAFAILGGVLAGMIVVLGVVSKRLGITPAPIIALIVVAGSLYFLSEAMAKLAAIPKEDLIKAGLAMGAIVLAIGAMLGILALAGLGSALIITGVVTLAAVLGVIAVVGLIAGAIGGLIGLIPGGQEFILSGIDFIGQVIQKIADIAGGIVGGILDGIISFFESLPTLSDIGTEIKEFMDSIQGIKPVGIGGIIAFGEAIAAIAAIEFVGFLSAVMEFVTGKSPVEQFASDLQELANGLAEWDRIMKDIDHLNIPTGMERLIEIILEIDLEGFVGAASDAFSLLVTGRSTMENFVRDLGLLGDALVDWQEKMEGIDEIKVPTTGIRKLNDVFLEIDLEGFVGAASDAWNYLITGKSTMENFVTDLGLLGDALVDWQEKMEGIDEIKVPTNAIRKFNDIFLEIDLEGLVGAALDGLTKALSGKTAMEKFTTNIGLLGDALSDWQEKMEGIDEIKVPTNAISDLVRSMDKISWSELKTSIKEWLSKLFGSEGEEDSVTTFSNKLGELAEGLATWQTKMDEIGTLTVPKKAIDDLVKALDDMPKDGGLIKAVTSLFTGEENFDTFKTKVGELGDALKTFSESLGEDFKVDAANSASTIIQAVADLGEAFRGQKWQDTISTMLVTLGQGLIKFSGYLQAFTLTELDVEKLTAMATASDQLAHVAEVMATFELTGDIINEDKIASFKTGIDTLKESIGSLSDLDTSGVDTLKQAADTLGTVDLQSAVNNMNSSAKSGASGASMHSEGAALGASFANGISSGKSSAAAAASTVASAAKGAFSGISMNSEGAAIGTSFANGILSAKGSASSAASSVASAAKSGMSGISMHSVGSDFTTGFANGILSGKASAMASAAAVARAAMQAVKDAINSHSPSKETYKLGDFFGQGFTLGIDDNITSSYRSGRGIANAAKNGLKDAAKSIRDVLESDLDAQPVVRPVLDLSEIQNGAGSIGDMLNTSPIGIAGNLTAINRNVNGRSMTTNDDVVSAISQLRRTLNGNLGTHNTYNVGGVTYDDGTNVAEAVRSLVRATRVERRA